MSLPRSSYSFNLPNSYSFSLSNLASSSLSFSFNSLSYLRSSYKFLLTTVFKELTSSNFLLSSSAILSYSNSLAFTSLFSWVAFSNSDSTIFSLFIKLTLSLSKFDICYSNFSYDSLNWRLFWRASLDSSTICSLDFKPSAS
jgi:hypothetical protein